VAAAVRDDGFEAAVFDLFRTLVPEFPRREFYDSVRGMAAILGADEEEFLEELSERLGVDPRACLFCGDGSYC
jgi:hypothetical protein